MKIYIPNSDAAILRGEEIEAKIDEIKDKSIRLEDRYFVLETLWLADGISDDEHDDLMWELDNERADDNS